MVIHILLGTLVLLLALSYVLFNNDIMAPPFLFTSGFVLSVTMAMYNLERWNINLQWKTYYVVVGGVSFFILTAFVIQACFGSSKRQASVYQAQKITSLISPEIRVHTFKHVLVILFILWTSYLLYQDAERVMRYYQATGSWAERIRTYNLALSYTSISEGLRTSRFSSWLLQISNCFAFVYIYILINNFIATGRIGKIEASIVAGLFACSFLTTSRMSLARYPLAMVVVYYVLWQRKNCWKNKNQLKMILACIFILVLIMAVFVMAKGFVGRTDTMDPIYYISFYAGASIPLLDSFLMYPPPQSDIWGKETFYAINDFIGRWFGIDRLLYLRPAEFRAANGVNMGNVYTLFKRYIYDFGYAGMFVLTGIFSAFFAVYYNHIKKTMPRRTYGIDFSLLIYSSMAYVLFLSFFSDFFYLEVVTVQTIKNIFFFKIQMWFLTEAEFVFGKASAPVTRKKDRRFMPI